MKVKKIKEDFFDDVKENIKEVFKGNDIYKLSRDAHKFLLSGISFVPHYSYNKFLRELDVIALAKILAKQPTVWTKRVQEDDDYINWLGKSNAYNFSETMIDIINAAREFLIMHNLTW